MTLRAALRLLTVGGLVLTLGGCGGSSESSTSSTTQGSSTSQGTTTQSTAPKGLPSASAAASSWAQAISANDCTAIGKASYAVTTSATRCTQLEQLAPKPKPGKIVTYGNAAAVDMTLGSGTHAIAIFLEHPTGGWGFLTVFPTKKSVIATPEKDAAAGTALIGRVLPAIASGSCTGVAGDFPTAKTPSATRTPANCFGHTGTPLQTLLKEGIGPAKSLGGDARLGFYSVGIGKGEARRVVVVLITQEGSLKFFGIFPGPRAAKAAKKH